MTELILVFLGSGLGGVLRYALTLVFMRFLSATTFPWAILCTNLLGSFLLGLLAGLYPEPQSRERLFWGIGCLGGFTTFSTLMWDTYRLKPIWGITNILASIALGLLAVWLGHKLALRR
jgi:fluoride exporter